MIDLIKRFLSFSASIVLLLIVWQIVIIVGQYPEFLMPSPQNVGLALTELFTDGRLFMHVWISFRRFIIGYVSACTIATVLGCFLGWFDWAWRLVEPIVLLVKPISPIAWLPFIMLWFGIGDPPAIFTISLAAFFPMLLTTVKAINNVNASYIQVADNFGFSKFQTLFKIILPASFPLLVQGLHNALSAAWIFLVAGETMAHTGLGFLINDARQNLRSDLIMAGIVLIGIIGYALDKLLTYAERCINKKWGV